VSWVYLRLLSTHIGFEVSFIRWVYFSVIINGSSSHFFDSKIGLRQGCHLSPLLFLLVVEGLNKTIGEERRNKTFLGIHISWTLQITHLLFVDDVIFFVGAQGEMWRP
jgi:hypothetical protein